MLITNAAILRRTTIFVVMLICVIFGSNSYRRLPLEASPDITIPFVLVTTSYEGVAPADMETLITLPIERKLRGLKNVEEIRSLSSEGSSIITVEFTPNIDIDNALQWVRDKVDQAKNDLPVDLEDDPSIFEINLSEFPILMVSVSGNVPETILKEAAEEMKDRIEEIAGVLDVEIIGARERQIRVEFNPERMSAYKLSFVEILSTIRRENVNIPGGSIDIGRGKFLLRIPGEFTDPYEVDHLMLQVRDGRPIFLKDVATVYDTFEDRLSHARIDGNDSITLSIKKRVGENIIAITDQVFALLQQAGSRLPEGIELTVTLNQSKDIRMMVSELENNILTGLILVVAVLFLFLGFGNAVFVAMAIPFSMLISFMILQGLGITLNMVVLFSLILALGMLVDNAIVMVENIYRHMQEGKNRIAAARAAADEIGWPIISSTLTTLCAFAPMLFWPGIIGEFMSFLPLTLIIVLSASLFVALVLNPVICSTMMHIPAGKKNPGEKRSLIIRIYQWCLEKALKYRVAVVVSCFIFLGAIVAIYGYFGLGVEFFPDTDPNRAFVEIKAPEGASLETSNVLALQVEEIAAKVEDLDYVIAGVGVGSSGDEIGSGPQTNLSRISLEFADREDRKLSSNLVLAQIRDSLAALSGAELKVEKEEKGPPTGPPVNIELSGERMVVLESLAKKVKSTIEDVPGLVDLKDDFSRAKPEIRVVVDRQKATLLGLSTREVSETVKAAISGYKLGVYREGKDEFDIVARLPESRRRNMSDIENLLVPTLTGAPVPLSTVAHVEIETGLGAIRHINQKRVITLSANTFGRNSNEVLYDVQRRLADLNPPAGYSITYSGEQEEQQKAADFLSRAFAAAIFLIALVLLTQFNSVSQSLIVLTSVILSLSGVLIGLMVSRLPFGIIMTGIGAISLAGVVVNNAIVLIDYVNQLRRQGLALHDALVRAGLVRFRPVMLTALTTILSLTPMAIGISFDFRSLTWEIGSESAQWWGPMAVAVIFGLALATALTLVVVPVLYSLSESMSWKGLIQPLRIRRRHAGLALSPQSTRRS